MTYWAGKVVVVTGGSAGLGLELAKFAVGQGARVALVARNRERLEAACKTLAEESPGAEVEGFATDITDFTQVEACCKQVIDRFERVDALFNCAGKSDRGDVLRTTPERFRELWELNFLGLANCTQVFIPELIKSRGHVVNIGSLASKSASKYLGAYPASKFPVAGYSQQLRLELADAGVHVLLACPGPIARKDSGYRYEDTDVPEAARQPGGGVKLKGLDPERLCKSILRACERRQLELVKPGKARLLFVISQISPALGDWLVAKMTRSN